MSKQDLQKKSELNQFKWETWFLCSIVLAFTIILFGTFENSKLLAEYPALALGSVLNLVVCVIVGIKPREY